MNLKKEACLVSVSAKWWGVCCFTCNIYVIGRRLFSGLSKISGLQCTVDVHVSCTQLYSVQIYTALASLLPFDEPIVR